MKRIICLLLVVIFLTGCGKENSAMEQAMRFRSSLLQAKTVSFDAAITADYGDVLHSFQMSCQWDSDEMKFTVVEPVSISGITGAISQDSGKIVFDDQALFFDTMADGMITPVSAPWVVMVAMQSGYIKGAGAQNNGYIIQLDDSYKENALHINLELNSDRIPSLAEIFYEGRRVLSINFENFIIL